MDTEPRPFADRTRAVVLGQSLDLDPSGDVLRVRTPKPPATGTIAGSVHFEVDNKLVVGGPIVLVNGQADSGPVANLSPGPHVVRAVYLGNVTSAPSGADLMQSVTP